MAQEKQLGDPLTPTEIKVVGLIARGYRDKDIAIQLCIAPSTVHKHLQNIFASLGLRSRTQLVVHAFKAGIIKLDDVESPVKIASPRRRREQQSGDVVVEFNEFLQHWCPPVQQQRLLTLMQRLVRYVIEEEMPDQLLQRNLERQINALPPLPSGELCAVCEEIRADPRLAHRYADPIPAVLHSAENSRPLCASCTIVDMAFSKASMEATIAALKKRQSEVAR